VCCLCTDKLEREERERERRDRREKREEREASSNRIVEKVAATES